MWKLNIWKSRIRIKWKNIYVLSSFFANLGFNIEGLFSFHFGILRRNKRVFFFLNMFFVFLFFFLLQPVMFQQVTLSCTLLMPWGESFQGSKLEQIWVNTSKAWSKITCSRDAQPYYSPIPSCPRSIPGQTARGPSVPNQGGLQGLQDPAVDTEMHQLDPLQDDPAAQLWGELST